MRSVVEPARIRVLRDGEVPKGSRYVLYWMQQSQRAEQNPALEYAVHRANEQDLPLLVVFGLTDAYPEANLRHYRFMLEGLRETRDALRERGIAFAIDCGSPDEIALRRGCDAAVIVCDRGYLRHQKVWRARVAAEAARPVHQVEGDVVVPVEVVSTKAEYAARTIRPKIGRWVDEYLVALEPTPLRRSDMSLGGGDVDLDDLDGALAKLDLDRSVAPVGHLFTGGTSEAQRQLRLLLDERMQSYKATRNQPQTSNVSHLSKYLHFGQISPVWVALQVRDSSAGSATDRESFLEEMIVRRELAHNFVEYTPDYDSYASLPAWARATLDKHRDDVRPQFYTLGQLERAETHDPYWNAAMREMLHTGYMHNYMRMYWGKKILEWTESPETAYTTALELNNRYFLDGRDPNSYANVGWLFGLHDRPWAEREIFGTVRYMSEGGLRRKSDPDAYVEKVERLVG